jgi:hypothetical protein
VTDLNEVHFLEGLVVPGFLDIQDGNDVLVVEVAEELHLTECAETEHGMIERSNLLDGDLLARRLMHGRAAMASVDHVAGRNGTANLPDHAVSALSHDILDIILLRHVEGDLARRVALLSLRTRHCGEVGERETRDGWGILVERLKMKEWIKLDCLTGGVRVSTRSKC